MTTLPRTYTGENPLNKWCQRNYIPHTKETHWDLSAPHTKLPKIHNFPHQSLPILPALKMDPPQQSAAYRKLLPTFSSPFFTYSHGGACQQVLKTLGFYLHGQGPVLSRSWSSSVSWGDWPPVNVNSARHCPEAKALANPRSSSTKVVMQIDLVGVHMLLRDTMKRLH